MNWCHSVSQIQEEQSGGPDAFIVCLCLLLAILDALLKHVGWQQRLCRPVLAVASAGQLLCQRR